MEVNGQLLSLGDLPGGNLLYRLGLGGPQNWAGRCGEERNLYTLARNRTPDLIVQSVVWLL